MKRFDTKSVLLGFVIACLFFFAIGAKRLMMEPGTYAYAITSDDNFCYVISADSRSRDRDYQLQLWKLSKDDFVRVSLGK